MLVAMTVVGVAVTVMVAVVTVVGVRPPVRASLGSRPTK